ncbi:hypothetical protein OLK001_29860 [Synechocystis sp. LKSZ1]
MALSPHDELNFVFAFIAFILHLMNLAHSVVCEAFKQQRISLKNLPQSVEALLTVYERQGLVQTVAELRIYNGLL